MPRNIIPKFLGEDDAEITQAFEHLKGAIKQARQDDGRGKRHVTRRMLAWRYYIRRLVTEQPFLRKAVPGTVIAVNTTAKSCNVVVPGEQSVVTNVKYYPPTKAPTIGSKHTVHFEVRLPTKTMNEDSQILEGERWIKLYRSRWLYWVVNSGNTATIRRQAWPIDPNADPEKDIETLRVITKPSGYTSHVLTATSKDSRLWFDAVDNQQFKRATHVWRIDDWGKKDLSEFTIGSDIPDFPYDSSVGADPPTGEMFFLLAGDHSPSAAEVKLLGHYQTRKWVQAYNVDIGFGGGWVYGDWEHVLANSENGVVWNKTTRKNYRPRIRLLDNESGIFFNQVIGSKPLWNENQNAWALTLDDGTKLRVYEWRYGSPAPASGQLVLTLDTSRPLPDQILKTPALSKLEVAGGAGIIPTDIVHPRPYTPPSGEPGWAPVGKTELTLNDTDPVYWGVFANGSQLFPSEEYQYTDYQLYKINLRTGIATAMKVEGIALTKLVTSSWDGQDVIAATRAENYYYTTDGGEHWSPFELQITTDFRAAKTPYTTMIFEGPS